MECGFEYSHQRRGSHQIQWQADSIIPISYVLSGTMLSPVAQRINSNVVKFHGGHQFGTHMIGCAMPGGREKPATTGCKSAADTPARTGKAGGSNPPTQTNSNLGAVWHQATTKDAIPQTLLGPCWRAGRA